MNFYEHLRALSFGCECSLHFTTLRSEHAQSMGDGVDALGVRSVASRLRVRGHARAVGRRALRPPIRVHQILGPRSEVDAWMAKGGIIGDFGQAPERQRRLSSAPKRRGLSSRGQRAALSERRGLSSGEPGHVDRAAMHLRWRLKSCSSECLEWHEKALWLAARGTAAPLGDSATAECVPNV